ncbi:hypothetical protein [Halalkalicoccus salilacus]|uniref:hypothetical protein n=1 Tax=Halalkalicoccus TaxID=332246 RepID=UPI002F964126
MNREGLIYELVHYAAVVAVAYAALFAAGALGVATLRGELSVALAVGVGYVACVLYFDLAPSSWRGNPPKD